MAIAYGYTRGSTKPQEITLKAQAREIKRHWHYTMKHKGVAWGGIFCDKAVHGDVPLAERPMGGQLQARLESGDVVICSKLDRAFRDIADCAVTVDVWNTQKIGVVLLDVPGCDTTTSAGMVIVHIMAAFAQFEKRRIAERTKAAMAELKRQGRPCNQKKPWGKKKVWDGKHFVLQTDEDERKIMSQIVDMYDNKNLYFDQISWALRKLAPPHDKRCGHIWTHNMARDAYASEMLLREEEANPKSKDQ